MVKVKNIIGKKIYIDGEYICDIFKDDIISIRVKGKKTDFICRGKVCLLKKEYLLLDCSVNFGSKIVYIEYKDILYILKEVRVKPGLTISNFKNEEEEEESGGR